MDCPPLVITRARHFISFTSFHVEWLHIFFCFTSMQNIRKNTCFFSVRSEMRNCRGLTRAIYILCIEHLRMLRLSREPNPGPPALQASTLCGTAVFSCHSGSHLCCYSSPPSRDGGSWLTVIRLRVEYAWRSDQMHVTA